MPDSGLIDRAVDNKILTLISRLSMTLVAITLPILFGYLSGLGNNIATLQTRMSVVEIVQQGHSTTISNNSASVADQMEELRRQNLLILQSIARLETKMGMADSTMK